MTKLQRYLLPILALSISMISFGTGCQSPVAAVATHTVTYNGNGSSSGGIPSDTHKYTLGQTVTVLGNAGALAKTGYSFNGWNTKADGTGATYPQDSTFYLGSSDIVLFAVWTVNSTFTVIYSENGKTGGSVPADTTNYHPGQMVTVIGNTGALSKTGSTFAGWNTTIDGTGTTYSQGQTFTIGSASVVLFAKWTTFPTYAVTYDANGKSSGTVPIDSTNYLKDQTITVLTNSGNITKTGYSFAGWSVDATRTSPVYPPATTLTMAEADVVLYASWTANVYSVTFDSQAAAVVASPITKTVTYPATTIDALPTPPAKTGYTFGGWYSAINGGGTVFTATIAISASITVYAKWNANVYTVSFDSQSASIAANPTSKTITYPATNIDALPTQPSKTGYGFSGWYTAINGGGTVFSAGTAVTGDVTVYANWIANTAMPTFDQMAGNYTGDLSVTISTTTGATIYYTTDNTTPTTASTQYSGAIAVGGNGTTMMIKAIAISGTTPISSVASASYTINYPPAAMPSFSPTKGNYSTDQNVILSTTTTGASIYYTMSTSGIPLNPASDSTKYTNPIVVSAGVPTTIKAVVPGLTGYAQSTIATITFNAYPEMVSVAGGTFNMGSPTGYGLQPVHSVDITSFKMSVIEVTQAQYQIVTGSNPSPSTLNTARPVEEVRWYEAVEYCNLLSVMDGREPAYVLTGRSPSTGYPFYFETVTMDISKNGYRLPTEAEWEFAARGGNLAHGYTYAGSNIINDVAWYSANSGGVAHRGGTKAPNELGIYDMCGNLWEWCWDLSSNYVTGYQLDPTGPASGSYRVLRGGSWINVDYTCSVMYRSSASAGSSSSLSGGTAGFRVVYR